MTALHNDWDTSTQRSESSSSITSSSDMEIAALKVKMAKINKNLMRVLQVNQQVKAVTPSYKICGGPYSFSYCPATVGNTQNIYAVGAYQGTLQGNTITNPKEDLKGITTQSGTTYQGPTIPTTSSSSPVVELERDTEATKDTVHTTNNGSIEDVQPLVVKTESLILKSEPVISPIIEPVASPVSAPKPNQRPSIPYPSKLHDQKLRDKANDQRDKFFQIFKDLNFNISFVDALILDFGCTKHMMGNLKLLCNFVEKFLGTVCFGNDQFVSILGYGDLVQGNVTINRVYYVEGLNYNLFSVGQFCDADLEIAFRKSTCFVIGIQGKDLLTGNHGSDLYIISLQDSTSSTPLCLMAKATPTQAWLWHQRLSHLNFNYINLLSKKIVQLILFIVDSRCTNHMTGNLTLLCNFVEKYLGTIRFGKDQFALILGYGDLVQGHIMINRFYNVKDLQRNDLLTGNRGSNLYIISLQETTSSTPICLMAKASPTQAWLWHR
nr:reverse transcriptase domain-containing protein [Tanacetum cinerariifolium]